ncbi:DEAD/DEAH box helicase [bacterium]|nr:DEAD/DEAH box helicase [bacterium]
MSRSQTDKWVRLALIAEALRRHGRGGARRLIQVKGQIHRFLGQLLFALSEERAHELREDLWPHLLHTDPESWQEIYNGGVRDEHKRLDDDPVPKAVVRALDRIELRELAEALKNMPVRARGGDERLTERLNEVRRALRRVEDNLWKELLARSRWRSPLLVLDEAHHLKNPGTSLARTLQCPDSEQDLRLGDGAMANAFDRMLFLTATPFQLGHHELVSVLQRFGDVKWNTVELGEQDAFRSRLASLGDQLTDSQRTAIAFQKAWSRLQPEDADGGTESWWDALTACNREALTHRQRGVVDAFDAARTARDSAEKALRPWVARHNKAQLWVGTEVPRRQRIHGEGITRHDGQGGLRIPPGQLLPFFLAARSAIQPGKDLLAEALCSSYEAFRFTRENKQAEKDEQDETANMGEDLGHAQWYLGEFDRMLGDSSGATHPKISATVGRIVDLWEAGEKVLVFAFYRYTCRALRLHISFEIERRLMADARRQLGGASDEEVDRLIDRVQNRYFDDKTRPGRIAVDGALNAILLKHADALERVGASDDDRERMLDVMRRFLRVQSTLVRCFPLAELDTIDPTVAVDRVLRHEDGSGISWLGKFDGFVKFLTTQCSTAERGFYLEAAARTQTRGIRVDAGDADDSGDSSRVTLANVQVATGETDRATRARLMRAFNTPFFPDILVCSEVMGEGVDLQRFCRHVIHHDLAWNPSSIEQRTGRIDRIGCKAEGRQPIVVYLPYLAGAADERQYRVMTDREQWFRVVMGQEEVSRLITEESESAIPLPDSLSNRLTFRLGLQDLRSA